MRSRDQSSQNNANATFNSLIVGTHQHDHQKFYKETQNLCGCWWWAHEQQVSEALSSVFVNSFSIFDLTTFLYSVKRFWIIKKGGRLTKSGITFVLYEIFGWNLAIIRWYEWPLSLQNLVLKFLILAKILANAEGSRFFETQCIYLYSHKFIHTKPRIHTV